MSQFQFFPFIDNQRLHQCPKFYILRHGWKPVPLFPLDELPSWMQFAMLDFNDPWVYQNMTLVYNDFYPRIGEYDVICSNCSASVDDLHRSVSERSDTKSDSTNPKVKENKSCPGGLLPLSFDHNLPKMLASEFWGLSSLKQLPVYPAVQTPYVGACLVDYQLPQNWVFDPSHIFSEPERKAKSQCPSLSSGSSKSSLNPEADVFDPPAKSTGAVTPPTPVSGVDSNPGNPGNGFNISIPSSAGTGANVGPNTPSSARGDESAPSVTVQDLNAGVEELKRLLGIKDYRRVPGAPQKRLKVSHHGKDGATDTPPNGMAGARGNRKRGRRKRMGGRKVAFNHPGGPHHENSSTKREGRRGKKLEKGKKEDKPGSRYWHMMRIPNWREGAPQ